MESPRSDVAGSSAPSEDAECDSADPLETESSVRYGSLFNMVDLIGFMEMQTPPHGECSSAPVHWLQTSSTLGSVSGYPIKEPLAYLRRAQMNWEKRLQSSLTSMCEKLNLPIARLRLTADRDELFDKWHELSHYEVDVSMYRPVFAPKDFFQVVMSLRSPNSIETRETRWEFSRLPLGSKTLHELRDTYAEIARGDPLLGVDRYIEALDPHYPTFEAERVFFGEKAILDGSQHAAQEFLKHGCPVTQRGRLWCQALSSHALPKDRDHYKCLKDYFLRYDLLIDKLIIKDVLVTASNDDQFFAFEDVLFEVLLLFTRDTQVLDLFQRCASSPLTGILNHLPDIVENTVAFPPCGVIPFHGFCMYAAPFAYLYEDSAQLYLTFRTAYIRYFYKLHEVSSHPEGIICLCLTYERLLKRHEPKLWLHFSEIGVLPVAPVFKWIMRAFSGHLPPDQLLFLWDVVFAYDSLEIIPLLACAILSFRKANLLKVNTHQAVEAVLGDISSIAVMPLIQFALMRK